MFGVIRENHEKRVKKGGVAGRMDAYGVACNSKQEHYVNVVFINSLHRFRPN